MAATITTDHRAFTMSAAAGDSIAIALQPASRSLARAALRCCRLHATYACLVDDIDDHCELSGLGTVVDHNHATDLHVHECLDLQQRHTEREKQKAAEQSVSERQEAGRRRRWQREGEQRQQKHARPTDHFCLL